MHSQLPHLRDLLVLLLSSVPIAFLFHRLRLPVLVGFMITCIVIGPYGLRLIHDVTAVEYLAKIGVVLLLLALGIEFSLRHIIEMKRMVFLDGDAHRRARISLGRQDDWRARSANNRGRYGSCRNPRRAARDQP